MPATTTKNNYGLDSEPGRLSQDFMREGWQCQRMCLVNGNIYTSHLPD